MSSPGRSPRTASYPDPGDPDLLWVSQYFDAVLGEEPLYEKLRDVFDADYPPSSLHRLLARLPALLRERGAEEQLLVLTTNYDDLVERAFEDAGERVRRRLVRGEARPAARAASGIGRRTGEPVPIKAANKYTGLALAERPVILKLHGAVDRDDTTRDSYVLTEDSYIDYLAGPYGRQADPVVAAGEDVGQPLPLPRLLDARLEHARDPEAALGQRASSARKSWAVQLEQAGEAAREVERQLWSRRGDVDLIYAPLREYVERLDAALTALRAPAPQP